MTAPAAIEIAGIPTSMTPAEAAELRELARGRNVLEIGSLFGYSTILMAQVANVVWAVDPHARYPDFDSESTLASFLVNLANYEVRDKVVPILAPGQMVLPHLRGFFDLIFIDITDGAKELIFLANNLDPRRIAIHDYGHPKWRGATEAIEAFFGLRSYPMRIVDTLAILDIHTGRDGYYE